MRLPCVQLTMLQGVITCAIPDRKKWRIFGRNWEKESLFLFLFLFLLLFLSLSFYSFCSLFRSLSLTLSISLALFLLLSFSYPLSSALFLLLSFYSSLSLAFALFSLPFSRSFYFSCSLSLALFLPHVYNMLVMYICSGNIGQISQVNMYVFVSCDSPYGLWDD